MSAYNLNVSINSQDVQEINSASQKIVIVKQVGGSSGQPVAWVSFSPFENNVVSWETSYGVYASSTEIQSGATINKTSAVNPATAEIVYPFENGTFGNPTSGDVSSNSYSISNKYSNQFTFGLAQSVTANGNKFEASPLNAVQVLSKQNATFTPIEKIAVFLRANFNNGVVISEIASNALDIDLTQQSNVNIRYDKALGQFVMSS